MSYSISFARHVVLSCLVTLSVTLFFSSCTKKPSNPPVPEGLTTLRITGPADRRVFFIVDRESVDGKSFNTRTTSGDRRLSIDGSPYDLTLAYNPDEYSGLRVRVYKTFEEPVTVALLAGSEVAESYQTGGAGEILEIKYGELRETTPPPFGNLRPNADQQSLINAVTSVLQTGSAEFPEGKSTPAFEKFGMLGVRALSAALTERYGPVAASSKPWVSIDREKGRGSVEGVVQAGETEVPLRLALIDGKLDQVKFLPPDASFRVLSFAEPILEENSRKFLTHFFKGEMKEAEEMAGYKKQLTPKYFDMLKKGTVGYWKDGEPLTSEGLYVAESLPTELHVASAFSVEADKSKYPYPQVWYGYYLVSEDSKWEAAEYFLINLAFTPSLDKLEEKVAK